MDFLKNAMNSAGGSGNHNQQQGQQQMGGQQQQGQQQMGGQQQQQGQQDYLDKAWQFASKKAGHDLAPGTDEKITDGMRGAYEKFSGKKVDPKYSN